MPPETKTDPMFLAACAAKTYNAHHLMAYAQLGPDLSILQISPNFASMAPSQPLTDAEIIHQNVADVLWEFVGVTDALQDILLGKSRSFKLEHVNREQPDGTVNYLTFLVYALEEDAQKHGLLLLVEDSTAYGRLHHNLVQDRNELRLVQRQLAAANEELIRLDRMKSLFLSMAAHDLRTPLSAIHGYSDLLLQEIVEPGSGKGTEYLSIIHHQSSRLNQLIDDLVDLDIIERGQLTVAFAPCEVNQLLNEVVTALRLNLERRQITVHSHLAAKPLHILAESEKILRVFYNLIGNAIKYNLSGGSIYLRSQQQDDKIIIDIEDNGPGMTQAQVDKLFTLYYRTEEAEKSQVAGSGLGLFIAKTMIEAHNGRIFVQSQLKKGTKFTIQLPKYDQP